MIPEIAIGALGAAAIAAIVSLLGLIISKEQKTSEFRQAWIDALRSEITSYLTHFNAISDATKVRYADHADKVKALAPHYTSLNQSNFNISLRLNPREQRSTRVLECIAKLQTLASRESDMTAENIRPIEADLLLAAKDLLKYEWRRVKRGELTFIVSKIIAFLLAISAVGYALLVTTSLSSNGTNLPPPANRNKPLGATPIEKPLEPESAPSPKATR